MAANEIMMEDGFKTLIELENIPTVKLYEKEVTPPGVSGGGPIDITTMRSTEWRQQAPKHLKTLTPLSMTVAYATDALEEVLAQVNVNQRATIRYPDGSHIRVWGFINEFTPGNHTEGEQPTATLTFEPTNHDNEEPHNEVGLQYFEPGELSEES